MFDWLIRDALVVDGTGRSPSRGDVGIQADRVAAVGSLSNTPAARAIEAGGRVVTPGFIDMHSHSDVLLFNGESLAHKITQGVTLELVGQDGISLAPVTESSAPHLADLMEPLAGRLAVPWKARDTAGLFDNLGAGGVPVNVATLVGHCNLRLAAMGHKMAAPNPDELEEMSRLLAAALDQGAVGLSLGLIYPPSSYSETAELVRLGRVVREKDGILIAHIRNEQDSLFQALNEFISVGRQSGCRIQVSHLKCMGKNQWGKMEEVLGLLEQAAREGVDVSFDQYPYDASCTSLSILLPGWAVEGGWGDFRRRLQEAESRRSMLSALAKSIDSRGGGAFITIASVSRPENRGWAGKNLDVIARHEGLPEEEMALRILEAEASQAVAIYHAIEEEDVERAMGHPFHTVGSDGILGAFPHPRAYGTFPRMIHHFCGEKRLFPLEEAVRRMTSSPAGRLRLRDRGRIAPGAFADLLLFDPARFQDHATYQNPTAPSTGLDWVFVNGQALVEDGRLLDVRPGRVLRRT
jgi:N-acyl-D-amino-acid deacylase